MREFVCILLQSVSNEVFALLGILLTNMGIFCLRTALQKLLYEIKSSFHTQQQQQQQKKEKERERIIIERIVKVVSFI